jgi:hypothetical protein
MAKITMDFWRDDHTGPACLEYSYVPEGKRRIIQLRPGQQEAIQADTVPDDLKPSHVQVYTLTNNDTVSLDMWQFPPGPRCRDRGPGERAPKANGSRWDGHLRRRDRQQRFCSARSVSASLS